MLPPPTAYRPWVARAGNRLFPRAWASGALPPPDLTEATLFAQARAAARADDFGGEAFLPALRALLPALRDAPLNPLGRVIAHGSALKVLIERAEVARLAAAHPEITQRPLARPVVIVGPMRSGTTRLHRLLACDPRFAHLRLYEAMFPVPGRARRAKSAAILRLLAHLNPAIAAVHPTWPGAPDEELGLLEHSFWGAQLEAQRPIPAYARWCEAADAAPAYAWLAQLLRLIGWARGEDAAKPWVLKTPQHMADLPALMARFPDARLIFTHRDPATVVASSASLAWNQMVLQVDHLDPHWVGAEWRHKTRQRIDAMQRARSGGVAGLDVRFGDFARDWEGTVARVYAYLGEALTRPVLAAMREYMTREEGGGRHLAHRYVGTDFGLDADALADEFADYAERYGVATRVRGKAHHGVSG